MTPTKRRARAKPAFHGIKPTSATQAHRARLRAQGMRPIQIWLPDTRSPSFRAAARAQSMAAAADPAEAKIIAEIEALADTAEWK